MAGRPHCPPAANVRLGWAGVNGAGARWPPGYWVSRHLTSYSRAGSRSPPNKVRGTASSPSPSGRLTRMAIGCAFFGTRTTLWRCLLGP